MLQLYTYIHTRVLASSSSSSFFTNLTFLARGKLMRRSIEKSRIQIEEGRDWCCQKTGMNGRNMARSSSKILGKSGAILNARRETVWQRRELSGPALIIFE